MILGTIFHTARPVSDTSTCGAGDYLSTAMARYDTWMRNSSRQLSKFSKVLDTLTSYTRTQQSAPR
eukprot:scaffold143762_cov48-Prasinocladus_malaysianus.AAC.1